MSIKKITERRLQMRKSLWPHLNDSDFWNRKTHDGFTTIPRTLPSILQIIDALSKNTPASTTYFDLWCRCYDEYIIDLKNEKDMAFGAGFIGQRAVQTWRGRIEILQELKFIETQSGTSGRHSQAVLPNPYNVIKFHRKKKTPGLANDFYFALVARANEV